MNKNVKKPHHKIKKGKVINYIAKEEIRENKIDNINSNAEKDITNEEIKMPKEENRNPKRKTKENEIIEKIKMDNTKLQTELNNKNEKIFKQKENNK